MKSALVAAFLLALVCAAVDGLQCYDCTYTTYKNSNRAQYTSECFSDWDKLSPRTCKPSELYCYISIDSTGEYEAISRGCVEQPWKQDGVYGQTSYSSCQGDGCNAAPSLLPGHHAAVLLILAALTVI